MTAPQSPHRAVGEIGFISPWLSEAEQDADPTTPTRHALFRELVFQVLRARYPWLLRVLEASGAQILAGQGCVYIAMPSAPQDWIPIPELNGSLWLMPWADPGEIAQ